MGVQAVEAPRDELSICAPGSKAPGPLDVERVLFEVADAADIRRSGLLPLLPGLAVGTGVDLRRQAGREGQRRCLETGVRLTD